MSKKALTLIIGVFALVFVAIAVYAATDTSPTLTNNTSITSDQVCGKNCDKNCEDCTCKCKNCDGDCENCDKDCCDNCKNTESCDKPCKGDGGVCGGCQGEVSGACQKNQEFGEFSG